jgi:cell division protein FtsL
MAVNTYRREESSQEGGLRIFSWLRAQLTMDGGFQQVIHVRFLPQIFFVAILCLFYIANRHKAEKKIRAISRLEVQVEDLRADYTTLKASYMFDSKQSEVAKRARKLGLKESEQEPILISIE